jgi:hypothetical protein
MTDTTKDGGQAFPSGDYVHGGEAGMTLRDYFAAKAMQASLTVIREFPDETWRDGLACDAYRMADAMLAAREAK